MKIVQKPKTIIEIIQMVLLVTPCSGALIWLLSNFYCSFISEKYLGKKAPKKHVFIMACVLFIYFFIIIIFPLSYFDSDQQITVITILYLIIGVLPLSLWLLWYQRKNIIDPMLEEKERRKQEK